MMYAEASADGFHFHHIGRWQDRQYDREKERRLIHMMDNYVRWERRYLAALHMDVREVIERADRAIKGEIQ